MQNVKRNPRIKSAPSLIDCVMAFLALCLVTFALVALDMPSGHRIYPAYCKNVKPASRLRCSTRLEYVTTPSERALGLSGRSFMPPDRGMLFVFERPGRQCMWMKDMKFNLDMIWLSPERKVQRILKDANPESYPESYCADGTSYVIELNAGTSDMLGLNIGDYTEL